MSIEVFDTFDGTAGPLLSHVGQTGATWTDHAIHNNSVSTDFKLAGDGELIGYAQSYANRRIVMASGQPAGAEYDFRAALHFWDVRGDGAPGLAFKVNPSTDNYFRFEYSTGVKVFRLVKVTGGTPTDLGSYADVVPADTVRNIDIRVRSGSPRIAIYIDGVARITSDDATDTGGQRLGVYSWGSGGSGPSAGQGMTWQNISAGSAGFVLPTYDVSGPTQGPPDAASTNFTVALLGGINPGSITITPTVSGMAGTIAPATVTLTDADRSKTFTFTPTGSGTATITFTNNTGAPNPGAWTYESGLFPPTRLTFYHTTFGKFATGGEQPFRGAAPRARGNGGYWEDGFDHYDTGYCFRKIRDYCLRKGISIPNAFKPEIAFSSVTHRDRGVLAIGRPGWAPNTRPGDWDDREGPGVPQWHRYMGGIRRHYEETGDPYDIAAADIMCSLAEGDAGSFSQTSTNIGIQREMGFWLHAMIDRAIMGMDEHPYMDELARLLLYYIDLWVLPYATKPYGIWLKPFMGALVARSLIHYWERYRGSADAEKVEVCGMIPGRIKAFSTYLMQPGGGGEPTLWFAEGTDWGNGWTQGSITYRDLPNADPKYAPVGPGLAITQVVNPRYIFRGPASLSTVDNYYKHSTFSVDAINDGFTILTYTGATREITLGSYRPARDITLADTFNIKPAAWTGDEGHGPEASLNGMIAPIHAWAYWHERRIVGNYAGSMVYRDRFHRVFNGNDQSWNQAYGQKQWNQSCLWLTDGLDWAERGDGPDWPVASALTLSAPATGLKVFAMRRSGAFRVSIPYGVRLDAPEVITPGRSGTGTLSAPGPVLHSVYRAGMFSITPAAGEVGTAPVISATGSTLPAPASLTLDVEPALAARDDAVKLYVASGPKQSGVGVESGRILMTLGAGTLAGTVRITPVATGGTFNPAYVDLTDTARAMWTKFTPSGAGARTITFTNNGGLTNPPGLPFQTDPYTSPGVAGYTISGPASGDTWTDSAPFTVALTAGDLPYVNSEDGNTVNPGTFRFTPYASEDFDGLGEFFPRYVDLTDQTRSQTFVYMPYTPGARTIGIHPIEGIASATWTAFTGVGAAGGPPVTTYTLTGPGTGEVNAQSLAFTVTLGAGEATGTIRFTPTASSGTGIFIPTYIDLNDSIRSGTFVFIPTSLGVRNISAPDNGGLLDPGTIAYEATISTAPAAPVDDSPRPGGSMFVGATGHKLIIPG